MSNNNLVLEIHRIKEIMGIINEGISSSWIQDLFTSAIRQTDNTIKIKFGTLPTQTDFDTIVNVLNKEIESGNENAKLLRNSVENIRGSNSFDDTMKKLILGNDENLEKQLIEDLVITRAKQLYKQSDLDKVLNKALDEKFKPIIISQSDSTTKYIESMFSKSGFDDVEFELRRLYSNLDEIPDKNGLIYKHNKKLFETLAEKYGVSLDDLSEIKTVDDTIENLQDSAKKSLSKNRGNFKKRFKDVFDSVLNNREWNLGKNWKEVLGEANFQKEMEGLDILEKLDPNKKYQVQYRLLDENGQQIKEITIPELRKILDGDTYKLFDNVDGNYSKVNFLDTNYTQNTEFFLSVAKNILGDEEYKKLIKYISDNNITPKTNFYSEMSGLMSKVFDYMKTTKSVWDDLMNNSESVSKIEISRGTGNKAEELWQNWMKELGYTSRWTGADGSPIDRILGIDNIFEIEGKVSTAQVKLFKGNISMTKNINEILGDSYKIFSSRRLEFSQSVDYAVLVDSNGSIMLMGKSNLINWEKLNAGDISNARSTETLLKPIAGPKPGSKVGVTFIDDTAAQVKFYMKNT
jgi:hypothetical protein